MTTLANSANLLDNTIEILSNEPATVPSDETSNLLEKWIKVLDQSENTQPLSHKLLELRDALKGADPQTDTIQLIMNDIADDTTEFATEVGPEGALPSQLEGIAAALRTLATQLS
jgi:hypothetical protein